jgi:hypothetical protein
VGRRRKTLAYEIETQPEHAFLSTPQRMWDASHPENDEPPVEAMSRWQAVHSWLGSLVSSLAEGCGRSSLED